MLAVIPCSRTRMYFNAPKLSGLAYRSGYHPYNISPLTMLYKKHLDVCGTLLMYAALR